MGVKVATTCLQWSKPVVSHSTSCSQTLASAISSPSSKRRKRNGALVCRFVQGLDRSTFFGITSPKLCRTRSLEHPKSRAGKIRRACTANLDSFSDEEFSKRIEELALRFQASENEDSSTDDDAESEMFSDSIDVVADNSEERFKNLAEESSKFSFPLNPVEPPWQEIRHDPPDWAVRDDILLTNIERKANSVDLPLSLRIIKRKKQWQEGFREAGESAYCSVKKAFSSMVFIIRELHSYTLQMREILSYQDLQGILVRVQKEIHASFVWLFQQVFSHTPTLMVYVMILLANFTVYSMANNTAIAVSPPSASYAATAATATAESVSISDTIPSDKQQKFDSSIIKNFSVSSSSGKTTSIGGNNGGGGKPRPIASGADGDGRFDRSDHHRTILPDAISQFSSESVSGPATTEEEVALWNSIVDEASEMQAALRDESLDTETMHSFVSPIKVKIEADQYEDYFRTEILYQIGLFLDPNNPLLLANYAQFLYVVAHDYDRAEEHFKKALAVEPPDAETYNKYANFLWLARKDHWAAEEMFQEAMAADPANSYYAASYANFLWSTGGEDTCFPLNSPDSTEDA